MPKKTNKASIEEKLNYLGLDLKEIPKEFKKYKSLEFRIPKFYDEKQYKQYRYVPIKDIQILLSPTHRLDNIEEKYKKARPIADYLDSESEENIVNHTTFLRMLESFNIEDVEKIGEEQDKLNKKIPFKVKYENNYLWQIYYSENTDQYFMLVPTEDSDYSTFFYLLKKQIEKKRAAKIFVPIRNVDYSTTYLKSPYKIKLDSEEKSTQFYKLLKAMFILQTELPHYFFFRTDIGKSGEIEFYVDNRKIDYEDIVDWINDEYHIGEEKLLQAEQSIEKNNKRLSDLKTEIATQEIEYLAKEKQISTFLECKKTFFGKFKYFFKYGKKKSNKAKASEDNSTIHIEKEASDENEELPKKRKKKTNYNIEELLELYKEINEKETDLKNIIMDINSLKLKNKNMQKKIENATAYIAEIDSHKKSIFEFWKYSNKDEMSSLPEGEEEEINVVKKITKVFDYEEDIEKFGKIMDRMQRKNLNKDETDSLYITATDLLTLINKIKLNDFTPKDIETALKEIKKEAAEEKTLTTEEFDIFGGMLQDNTKVSKIKNKKHREMPKDKYNILEISKTTKQIGFKMALENVINNVKEAINKVVVPEDVPVYKAIIGDKLDEKQVNIFNITPENEMKQAILEPANKINFYKINLPEGANAISYTNCIFYDNQNRTLPEGQDLSTNILIDITKLDLKLSNKTKFKIVEMEEPNDDFSGINIKNVNVFEFDAEVKKTNENNG